MHRGFAIFTMSAVVAGLGFVGTQRLASVSAQASAPAGTRTVTFAGGCFWGLEAAFRQVPGVTDTTVGYVDVGAPNFARQSSTPHQTNRLEACRVTFDPSRISYEKLVTYFFATHNPKIGDGKAPYLGSPARLVILIHNADEQRIAEAVRDRLQPLQDSTRPRVIQIAPEGSFDRADESDQRYLEKHGLASCRLGS